MTSRPADKACSAPVRQTWLRDPATNNYLLDVFGEPHEGWICRHDERIQDPYS